MDRIRLSEASIHNLVEAFADEVTGLTLPARSDLETIEQQVQALGRRVLGAVAQALVHAQAETVERPQACGRCGQPLRLVGARRGRQVQGLVGEISVERALYACRACGQGHAPLDTLLGLGPWGVTPALARVISRAGSRDSFVEAAESVEEMLGVPVPVETVRVLTEAIGAVAEAEQQEAIAALRARQRAESEGVETLLVEVDGVQVRERDGWHEMKIGRAAPLGPDTQTDAPTGRTTLVLGPSVCGGGLEAAEESWWRVRVLAEQAGLGRATRRVVVVCDGAEWIWSRAAAFLGGPGREVIEIVDIFHAYEHLWAVGHALYPEAAACAAWVAPLKDALYTQGACAVLAALEAAQSATPEAAAVLERTQGYFRTHAARMDYPCFVAAQLPIGSGAIESLCKNLVEQRAKGAGMRWTATGLQAVVRLRAVQRSGEWAAFWARHPLHSYQRRWPRQPRPRRSHAAASTAPTVPLAPTPILRLPSYPWKRGPAVLPRRSA